jgi:hypothetical protein
MTTFVCLAWRVDSIIFVQKRERKNEKEINFFFDYIERERQREGRAGWMRRYPPSLSFSSVLCRMFSAFVVKPGDRKTPRAPASQQFGRVYSVSVSCAAAV